MCGIAIMLGLNGMQADRGVVERMTASLQHRGPDAAGIHMAGSVGLGFRRLSILDLSHAADQPMVSEDGQLVLVFNGEIFNYVELRRELEALGHEFKSSGDTEVLLQSYRQWGRDCVEKLNGMWAFLVYDHRRGILFGARDRFGVKPLYVHHGEHCVLFASEIKAVLKSGLCRAVPNWTIASAYLLRHRLDESSESFYEGITQIAPGTAFEVNLAGQMKAWRYWSLPLPSAEEIKDPAAAFCELFEDAVRLRMRSDVPVGVCLSGGLDSTAIICAMARQWNGSAQPLHAFAYQAPEFDESAFIADTLKMTQAHLNRLETNPETAWKSLDKVLSFHDEPVHAMSAVMGFELMGLAASRGVKVVLNGQGADEVIGGYSSYFRDYWFTLLNSGKLKETWAEIGAFASHHRADRMRLFLNVVRHLLGVALSRSESYRGLTQWKRSRDARRHPWFSENLAAHLADDTQDGADWTLDAILRRSVERGPLPLYLRLEDRNSMAHSVECRLPFMDYRLVSLVFKCADDWKLHGPWNKYLLRESMRRRIPESVRTRIDKWGFPVPQGKWISGPWYEPLQDLLVSRETRERGIYNVAAIQRDLDLHRQGSVDATGAMFRFAQFELWARRLDSFNGAAARALG